jgi:hypothetical protein
MKFPLPRIFGGGEFAVVMLAGALTTCQTLNYERIPTGEIGGRLTIEWVGPDQFIYRPDAERPFYFKRVNGEVIKPGSIYTDGGTVPRLFWAMRGYSPWAFGSAYIAHDWLFAAHHCGYPEAQNHNLGTAADVLDECIKTQMENDQLRAQKEGHPDDSLRDPGLLRNIDIAVRSVIAQKMWNTGPCQTPPPELPQARNFRQPRAPAEIPPEKTRLIETYDFDANKP